MWQLAQGLYRWVGQVFYFLSNFWDSITAVLGDFCVSMFGEVVQFYWSLLSAIPVPDVLKNFHLPTPGPVAQMLYLLDVPQAVAILTAAFAIKMSIKLIPFLLA